MGKRRRRYFPEEIIINIISRLPPSSIARFRCVSKSWRTLLSQPHFFQTHLHHIRTSKFQQRSFVFINPLSGSLCYLSLPSFNAHVFDQTKLSYDNHWSTVRGSCDGLVLLDTSKGDLFLVNPITKEMKQVPVPRLYNPSLYGFGYDLVNDDYKIVILSGTFAFVYSVKNGIWNKTYNSPYYYYHRYVGSVESVFVEGRIHWIVSKSGSSSSVISAFDLAHEKFFEVTPPRSISKSLKSGYYLEELQGCLSIIYKTNQNNQAYINVWIMKEYGNKESWTKLNKIPYDGVYCTPICMLVQEQALVLLMPKDESPSDAKFATYNLKNETLSDVKILSRSHFPKFSFFLSRGTFVESLVSPHYK